jgi:L,D-transpeptidase ErfK/SrfK
MYLAWPAYLIHGTHDTRKIGSRSSDGCIGLHNEKIEELFALAPIGTQVRII